MLYALAMKELRLLSRDVHGLAVLFLMPTIFILIMSLAMQNTFSGGDGPMMTAAVQVDDAGLMGDRVVKQLGNSGVVEIVPAESPHDFWLQLPAGFSDQLFDAPGDPAHALLSLSSDRAVLPQVRETFRRLVIVTVMRVQGEGLIRDFERQQGRDLTHVRRIMDSQDWHIGMRAGPGSKLPTAVQQSVPGWLVFAMFFVVIPLSAVIITEREQGTALRLRALQVPAWRLLLSRLPPYFILNMLQLAAMLAVGIWLVPLLGGQPLSLGDRPLELLVIAVPTSLAAIGLSLLVATVARTTVQAIALGGTLNLVFAALGGIMVPKIVMPAAMQQAAMLSPMDWAFEGFQDILLRSGSLRDVLPQCAALVAFGAACLGVASILYHRKHYD